MELVENEKDDWNEDSIKIHQKDMVKFLLDDLSCITS